MKTVQTILQENATDHVKSFCKVWSIARKLNNPKTHGLAVAYLRSKAAEMSPRDASWNTIHNELNQFFPYKQAA